MATTQLDTENLSQFGTGLGASAQDATAAQPFEERELLDQVEALSFRYMDGGLVWQTTWPTPILLNGPPQDLLRARPVAIEVTLQLKDWGNLLRVFEIAG